LFPGRFFRLFGKAVMVFLAGIKALMLLPRRVAALLLDLNAFLLTPLTTGCSVVSTKTAEVGILQAEFGVR